MGKEKFLPVVAISVLFLGIFCSLYVNARMVDSTEVLVHETTYSFDQLFIFYEEISMEIEGIMYSGIGLDELLIKSGVDTPETHLYQIHGSDSYQKTVTWDNIKNGVLTREGVVVFNNLPKAFWIKDVVHIEVK